MAEDPRSALVALLEEEQRQPIPAEAATLVGEIRRRHGAAVVAVYYYGSCLRKASVEGGVLDFYCIVDSYRAAYRSWLLAASNAALPPNVYYVELATPSGALRMKYAVVSRRDFAAACRPESLHAIIWARFCQPSALAWLRDEADRTQLAADTAEAAVTMTSRMLALHPGCRTDEELWQAGFATTYTTELRPETPETIRTVHAADPGRYRRVAALAIEVLGRRGQAQGRLEPDGRLGARMTAAAARAVEASWRRKLPVAKGLYVLRLIKSALTFGDWLPYALWKLGRHTGVVIVPTERQRRHPLIFGWPVLLRLVRGRTLR